MQSENIVQENGIIQTKTNASAIVSPNTKQNQPLEDKTNISQNQSSNIDHSILGKRLYTEKGRSNNLVGVSGDRSPFSEPQQNISASLGNSANTSYVEDKADGAHDEDSGAADFAQENALAPSKRMKVIEPTHKPGTLLPFYEQKDRSMLQRQVSQTNIKSLGLSVNMVNEQDLENQRSEQNAASSEQ